MDKRQLIYQLEISKLSEFQVLLVTAELDDAGVTAIEEVEDSLIIYHAEETFVRGQKKVLLETFDWLSDDHVQVTSFPNENWNEKWESSFDPIIIEDLCTVRASFHEIDIDTPYTITINPELAFGTGHHETTYQMMAAMRELTFHDKRVLDYGCGTGILAILAHLMGARDIDAIDYDPQAIECAADCFSLNEVGGINLFTGELDLLSHKTYDIILANINRKVLLESSESLHQLLSHSGILLLSGILHSDFDLIKDSYVAAGFILADQKQKGEWLCLKMAKM